MDYYLGLKCFGGSWTGVKVGLITWKFINQEGMFNKRIFKGYFRRWEAWELMGAFPFFPALAQPGYNLTRPRSNRSPIGQPVFGLCRTP